MPKPKVKIPRITFPAVQPIDLSDENWKTLEKAYGHRISPQVRAQIKVVTARFLRFAVAEDTGLMKDAVRRVTRLRNCALSLINAIDAQPITDVTRDYADETLGMNYARLNGHKLYKAVRVRTAPLATHKYVREIYADLERFVNACNGTLEEFDDVSQNYYWLTGGAWEVWIRDLTGILEEQHLPKGASKDTAIRVSPFVALVYKLQTFLPKRHMRAQHSEGALATAITKAREASQPALVRKKLDRRGSAR
jgi:hypothetical protein